MGHLPERGRRHGCGDPAAVRGVQDRHKRLGGHPSARRTVRANWSSIFQGVPDFAAELLGHTHDEAQEWSEWRWAGTRQDDSALNAAGVIVSGVVGGRIAWARLYMEPVEAAEQSIDAAVRNMATGSSERE